MLHSSNSQVLLALLLGTTASFILYSSMFKPATYLLSTANTLIALQRSSLTNPHQLHQAINTHPQTMLSPIYILFALVVLGMPFYESYERLHHPPDTHIPKQIKFTAQSTVGFSTAIHSFCDLARLRRSSDSSAFLCPALAVGGGSAFGAAMTRLWNEEDWKWLG